MSDSRMFRKIRNTHLQQLFGINVKQATRMLNKIRVKCGKNTTDAVRLHELCEHERLEMEKICSFFKWKD